MANKKEKEKRQLLLKWPNSQLYKCFVTFLLLTSTPLILAKLANLTDVILFAFNFTLSISNLILFPVKLLADILYKLFQLTIGATYYIGWDFY